MQLPFRRDALRERARLDEADEAEAYARTTPDERIERCLELSELACDLAESVGGAWVGEAGASLEENAQLYVAPLRLVLR